MTGRDFSARRRDRWQRLEAILNRLESTSAKKLPQNELDEFVYLYRSACTDLARARSEELGENIETYLNTIVARGHKQFRPPGRPDAGVIKDFFARDFPVAVRSMKWYVISAALLFIVPLGISAVVVALNPPSAYLLASPEQLESLADAYAKGHVGGRSESVDTFMAGYYINHNVGIAFQCFATGIFFGLGSIFALLFNGLAIGAIGAYICVSGYATSFLSFVAGHGSFELTAIVLSGAVGMRMGMILVNPGPWKRLDAFKIHSTPMLRVVFGSAVMLTIAAFIEAFWSPSGSPAIVKIVVGILLWVVVLTYLLFAGGQDWVALSNADVSDENEVHR